MLAYKATSLRRCTSVLVREHRCLSISAQCQGQLDNLHFTNRSFKALPKEGETRIFPRQVSGAVFSQAESNPIVNPRLVAVSPSALGLINITEKETQSDDFIQYFSGNKQLPHSLSLAHCYCGHQYGLFSGQLGDGAAMYLGEVQSQSGQHWELHLKGSGRTPYARATADGRKVLRSSIREFLASEAMHHLGIPTTRAATCMTSDTMVTRDPLWTGETVQERATVVLRLAQSFLRIGSLEIVNGPDETTGKHGPSPGETELLRKILDHVIAIHYPELTYSGEKSKYLSFFDELLKRSARLVAQWQSLGFCHGVMNTDNISLVGLTMDYGPYEFMQTYDPDHICNGSDFGGLFSFANQPKMMKWCFQKLVFTMSQVVPHDDLSAILDSFESYFEDYFLQIMRKKLGLQKSNEGDKELIDDLMKTMQLTGSDYTGIFRSLCDLHLPEDGKSEENIESILTKLMDLRCSAKKLKEVYAIKPHATKEQLERSLWVLQTTPHLSQMYVDKANQAIDAYNNRPILQYAQDLKESTKREQDKMNWKKWLVEYKKRLEEETGKSGYGTEANMKRTEAMKMVNPRFILKNNLLQECIDKAEKEDDYGMIKRLLRIVEDPYEDQPAMNTCSTEEKEDIAIILEKHDQDVGRKRHKITCSS